MDWESNKKQVKVLSDNIYQTMNDLHGGSQMMTRGIMRTMVMMRPSPIGFGRCVLVVTLSCGHTYKASQKFSRDNKAGDSFGCIECSKAIISEHNA